MDNTYLISRKGGGEGGKHKTQTMTMMTVVVVIIVLTFYLLSIGGTHYHLLSILSLFTYYQ